MLGQAESLHSPTSTHIQQLGLNLNLSKGYMTRDESRILVVRLPSTIRHTDIRPDHSTCWELLTLKLTICLSRSHHQKLKPDRTEDAQSQQANSSRLKFSCHTKNPEQSRGTKTVQDQSVRLVLIKPGQSIRLAKSAWCSNSSLAIRRVVKILLRLFSSFTVAQLLSGKHEFSLNLDRDRSRGIQSGPLWLNRRCD